MTSMRAFALFSLVILPCSVNCGGRDDSAAQRDGAANGGSGAAGGKQSGGTGGGSSSTPGPQTHLSECEALCARTADAGCSAGADSCVMLCATVTGFAGCQSSISNWLACAKTAAVVCDESGAPGFAGCDASMLLAVGCAATTPAPPVVQQSCSSYCDAVEASGCSATTPVGDCRSACGMAGIVVASCQSDFLAYMSCAVKSGISCDANGQVDPAICTAEQFLYTGCLLSALGMSTLPDGLSADILTGAAGSSAGIY